MAKAVSQIKKVEAFLKKNPAGVTVSAIARGTRVPKGNILPHIAMLRNKFKLPVETVRRQDANGSRKVYFETKVKA